MPSSGLRHQVYTRYIDNHASKTLIHIKKQTNIPTDIRNNTGSLPLLFHTVPEAFKKKRI